MNYEEITGIASDAGDGGMKAAREASRVLSTVKDVDVRMALRALFEGRSDELEAQGVNREPAEREALNGMLGVIADRWEVVYPPPG
ncbi:MAG: hypothetical protein QOF78_279 [Phycisphaerales bacterium]|jgi:hypothetical protein|nr:hypothetical protein [Phycisphaerales bacterium]